MTGERVSPGVVIGDFDHTDSPFGTDFVQSRPASKVTAPCDLRSRAPMVTKRLHRAGN
jgi:hypothetical protein